MTEGEFPFRSFTMRSEGYDRGEVDSYIAELQREITELRRALETATPSGDGSGDTRLHDPEGAVTRTLAIAQETADRVLHDAQIEADRRRAEADEQAAATISSADERAARILADMETQAAEVREQGVAAARSAIQVERDRAMGELGHVRRVRDDLRTEATELKTMLDGYRNQAREASDTLDAVSSGPLMAMDLPAFVDDDVALAGIATTADDDDYEDYDDDLDDEDYDDENLDDADDHELEGVADESESEDPGVAEGAAAESDGADVSEDEGAVATPEGSHLRSVDDVGQDLGQESADGPDGLAQVIAIDGSDDGDDDDEEETTAADAGSGELFSAQDARETVIMEVPDRSPTAETADSADDDFGGTFLAEVRAAATDDVPTAPEDSETDRFLSELRGLSGEASDELDSDAAETFFDDDA